MSNQLAVIIGTTMGNAEAVADEIEASLTEFGFEVQQTLDPQPELLAQCRHWLIVCSTHGAGDIPDNLHPWVEWLKQQPDLSNHKFALCGIGDRSYDTFCGATKQLDPLLRSCGASPFVDNIEIDVQHLDLPEDQALSWIESWPEGIL